jgi:hypothetical protein
MGDINWEGLMDEIGSDIPLSIDIFGGGSSPFNDINWQGLSDAVGSYIPFQDVFNLSDYLGDDWLKDIDLGTKGLDLSPAAEKILFEDLPYISSNFYGDDVVIPGQLGGFNPDAPPIGFNLGQDPGVWLDYYGYGAGDFMPDYFKDKEPVGGAHTTVDAVLGPSGRPQINTTPGGNSTKYTEGPVKGLPGSPSGTSVREPSTTNTSTTTTGGTKTTGTTGTTTGKGLSLGGVLGGLAAMGLLGKVLGLFDSSGSSDKYTGIKIPKVTDITKPDTPQIAPVRVVPVPVQVPVVSQETKDRLAKNLGSTPLAHGGLARAAMPYMLARGGRLDFRHGAPVRGEGTGQSDDIPALLSDGEYVIDADTVAALGDGSNKAGAETLDKFREQIRKHKRSAPHDKIPPKAKSPLAYLKEVK